MQPRSSPKLIYPRPASGVGRGGLSSQYSPLDHQAEIGILSGEDNGTLSPKGEMREASKQRGIGGCYAVRYPAWMLRLKVRTNKRGKAFVRLPPDCSKGAARCITALHIMGDRRTADLAPLPSCTAGGKV